MRTHPRRRRVIAATVLAATAGVALAAPASVCGGLIGENGSIQLGRTTTLAAWHDGVEHYVTSFEFSGTGESLGSIIPLPAVPTDVVAAGEWTLQRLQIEVAPPVEEFAQTAGASDAASAPAEVLLETTVDALDITVLRGGGDAVGEWALENGFFLTPDAPEVLDFYAERSEIFLAAKFNTARAAEQGLTTGQGTPIHITMPLERPWVPLRILGLGLPAESIVQADVFLLTDERPTLLAGGNGLSVNRSEQASDSLMTDLSSDRGMEWMPEDMWLTHLLLDDSAGELTYDLSVSAGGRDASSIEAGLRDGAAPNFVGRIPAADGPSNTARTLALVAVGFGAVLLVGGFALQLRPNRNRRA